MLWAAVTPWHLRTEAAARTLVRALGGGKGGADSHSSEEAVNKDIRTWNVDIIFDFP